MKNLIRFHFFDLFCTENQLRKRILSVKSVTSEKEETVEAEEVEEDLPDIPFSRVFKMNKPEICYIIGKSILHISIYRYNFI